MAHTKSVSIGIFVKSGSMYETKEENGISHFIEHMLFKGTAGRSAMKIAEEMDFVGGHINAYTTKEYTCYYTKVLSEDLPLSVDILSDMYYNSLFKEEDIELERSVIIEEINMYEDSPEDISGTIESVSAISRDMLISYMKRRYTPENTVLSVAGNFEEDELIALAEKYFSQGENATETKFDKPVFTPGMWERKKDIEQTHLAIAFPGYPLGHPKNYTITILSSILGGSMSSRLFQKLREENGLCYSIYTYTGAFPDAGAFGIYAGIADKSLEKAIEMIDDEIDRLKKEKVTAYEIKKAFSQIRCAILMSRESTSARMTDFGKELILRGKIRTDEEVLTSLEKVTEDDIMECANEIFDKNNRGVFILNPL